MGAWLVLAALAAVGTPAAAQGSSLERTAVQIAERAGELGPPGQTSLAVALVSPETPDLGRAAQTLLVSRLARIFRSVVPLRVNALESAEAEARQLPADWVLRLTARIAGGELVVAGDAVPTWTNFWLGNSLARTAGGLAFAARAPVDAEVLTLARLGKVAGAIPGQLARRFHLRPLATVPERVVALAVGDLDADGAAEIAALTATQVLLFKADGQLLARYDHASLPMSPRPPREASGAIAIGPFGAEPNRVRIAFLWYGQARGGVLELDRGELRLIQPLDAAPVGAGAQGVVVGAPQPGRSALAPEIRVASGKSTALSLAPVAVAVNPRAGAPALLAISAEGSAVALGEDFLPLDLALPPLGAGLALGDFDGDGVSELAASGLVLADDRIRILRLDGKSGAPLFESEPLPGAVNAGAAGDLNGDGRDEAVLGAWLPDGSSQLYVLGGEP